MQTEKLKVGDKAVYPAQGVGEVIRIEEIEIAGAKQFVYVLQLLSDPKRMVKVPVSNPHALRAIINEEEIGDLFDILKERPVKFDNQTWNRRFRGFMDKIKTGSIYDVAEVMRDLYRLKAEKPLSFGERKMLEQARNLIVKEIAIARDHSEEKVRGDIESLFDAN